MDQHPAYPAPAPAPAAAGVDSGGDQAERGDQAGAAVTGDSGVGRRERARARTAARDAAYGWTSARRRVDQRTREWVAATERARELGASPEVLGGYVREAADRAGVPLSEVPGEVWRAAGWSGPPAG